MKAAVIGCGAWGTALANCLCKNGFDTVLWCHDAALARNIREAGINPMLEGVPLHTNLQTSAEADCVQDCDLVVIATSSVFVRSSSRMIAPYLRQDAVVVSVVKGVESGTMLRMSQIVEEETGHTVVALTGPSHAEEVGREMPTGCLAACPSRAKAEFVQKAFCNDVFRIYVSDDIVGAELGGALKNIIALCAGVADGLGYGDNTKALLMTRGMAEIARLGTAMGGRTETFFGLAGIGDLIVTCTSMHSRNRRAGILVGQGLKAQDAMAQVGAVVEGYYAAKSAWELANAYGVDMPICVAAYNVLYAGGDARQELIEMLARPVTTEALYEH
ncbi:MAG: NAD(P)-dependent glycerol-3-phosphate dehydrogenase [Ruminococcaceae bacterium]|nr:NAD(P)-dependent glycerol-3-phosphate dehydrogenase [Oscillospiraceae bacterium]